MDLRCGLLLASCLIGCIEVERPPIDPAGNAPPIAVAQTGGYGTVGLRVVLDGSASFDPDGTELTYAWTILDAPRSEAQIEDPDQAEAALRFDAPGEWVIELTVTDAGGASDSSAIEFYARSALLEPDAGGHQSFRRAP